MQIKTFSQDEYVKPERTGRPSTLIPALQVAVENAEIFSVPVYTSSVNKIVDSGQVQSNRIIQAMREIAPKWRYAYHNGVTLELVLVPPRTKVSFETKALVTE